jgi:hypothetical protein
MPKKDDKGDNKGRRFDYMIQDEISEYFSKDIQFDWPEPYEPRFPLTSAEEKLEALNKYPGSFVDYTHGRLRLVPINQDASEWLQAELSPVVQEELDRAETNDKKDDK